MDLGSPSFEASLLYKAAVSYDADQLALDIGGIARRHGLTFRTAEQMDRIFLLFDCDEIQMLLAFCDDPLPTAHFLDANRPKAATSCERTILYKVASHSASTTVLVLDHPNATARRDQVHGALKRDLCWDIACYLSARTSPDLVFWCDDDTLYTAEEYRRACDFRAAQQSPQAADRQDGHEHLRADPVLPAQAVDWINTKTLAGTDPETEPEAERAGTGEEAQPAPRKAAAMTLETLFSLAMPNRLSLHLDRLLGRWTARRAMRSVAMACAGATVGLSGLADIGLYF
ncbi:MAG: hypothetical protein QNJ44_11635 [Rhodobacter sp.]|nr:hypothetical protein [Rhodobacter sp.]